jgi:hypothetical protein
LDVRQKQLDAKETALTNRETALAVKEAAIAFKGITSEAQMPSAAAAQTPGLVPASAGRPSAAAAAAASGGAKVANSQDMQKGASCGERGSKMMNLNSSEIVPKSVASPLAPISATSPPAALGVRKDATNVTDVAKRPQTSSSMAAAAAAAVFGAAGGMVAAVIGVSSNVIRRTPPSTPTHPTTVTAGMNLQKLVS